MLEIEDSWPGVVCYLYLEDSRSDAELASSIMQASDRYMRPCGVD